MGASWAAVGVVSALAVGRCALRLALNNAETSAQLNSLLRQPGATRHRNGPCSGAWLSRTSRSATQQTRSRSDQLDVASQEQRIAAGPGRPTPRPTVDFLASKFTNAELYAWMAGVLGRVYGYFLQQATAVAQLAQHQLAFERQETPPARSSRPTTGRRRRRSNGAATDGGAPDRRGLTGSARLLQDVYQLDQLRLRDRQAQAPARKTFSLAAAWRRFEFQRFRETGVLRFATPMELFDRDFPATTCA